MSDEKPIEGKRVYVTRLDAEGNPTGKTFGVPVKEISLTPEYDESDPFVSFVSPSTLKRLTVDVTLLKPEPELIALLTGVKIPRWYRWLPKSLQYRDMRRRLRRAYGA